MAATAVVLVLVGLSSPDRALAQAAQETQQEAREATQITLVYEREVYSYQDRGRRDPFRPLTDDDSSGPRFEELVLQGVIYSTGRTPSVALIADASGRIYRVRVGDTIGGSRVVEIGPLRVVMAVDNFGTIRQEMLELRKSGGGDR